MKGWIEEHRTMDQEDRANEAKGAMMCMHELFSNQDMLSTIDPQKLVYLHKAVMYVVFEAIPDGTCNRPYAVNDRDAPG